MGDPRAINAEFFPTYVETQLVPTLSRGDVVILVNLSSHKCPRAAQALQDIGAWFVFLPPCSPDLNRPCGDCTQSPVGQWIEMAFSKLKTLIRKSAARTYDELWRTAGPVCDLFSPQECANYLEAAGYEGN